MRDENIAADLTQDVFLKVVAAIHKYRYTGKFFNYLFTIAINACNDYSRKNQHAIDCDMDTLQAPQPQPLDIVIKKEEEKKLNSLLYSLPDIQRDTLILYYYHDMKAKDIAQITGVSVATAKSRIKQGLDKLIKAYKKEGGHEE